MHRDTLPFALGDSPVMIYVDRVEPIVAVSVGSILAKKLLTIHDAIREQQLKFERGAKRRCSCGP
jgi:hypothetical protein